MGLLLNVSFQSGFLLNKLIELHNFFLVLLFFLLQKLCLTQMNTFPQDLKYFIGFSLGCLVLDYRSDLWLFMLNPYRNNWLSRILLHYTYFLITQSWIIFFQFNWDRIVISVREKKKKTNSFLIIILCITDH